jgi:hypothetical protein
MGNLSFARSRATMVTFVLAAMLVGVAHASDTEVNKAAEAPAPASAPSATPAAAPAETPAETPAVKAPVAAEPTLKVPAGWRKQTRNGDVAYCRKIVTLGSRFEKLQCMSEAELEQYITMNEENRDTMQQRISICGTSSVCSNP